MSVNRGACCCCQRSAHHTFAFYDASLRELISTNEGKNFHLVDPKGALWCNFVKLFFIVAESKMMLVHETMSGKAACDGSHY